jgi:hypothetical protein
MCVRAWKTVGSETSVSLLSDRSRCCTQHIKPQQTGAVSLTSSFLPCLVPCQQEPTHTTDTCPLPDGDSHQTHTTHEYCELSAQALPYQASNAGHWLTPQRRLTVMPGSCEMARARICMVPSPMPWCARLIDLVYDCTTHTQPTHAEGGGQAQSGQEGHGVLRIRQTSRLWPRPEARSRIGWISQ